MSLKVPESAVLWLDEKSPYSKVEVKSSKHSHDALWSKKKKKNLDYKDNSSSQWRALMSHSHCTRPAQIIKMDLGGGKEKKVMSARSTCMRPLYALKYYFMLGIKACVLLGLCSGCRYSLPPLRHLRRSFKKCENQMWAVAIYIVRTQRERDS